MKSESESFDEIFGSAPRNDWERTERRLINDLYTYVFKDPRSIDAYCRLIFFYRERIAELNLLRADCGET